MPADAGIHPMRLRLLTVMPADAGIHPTRLSKLPPGWAPASAGVTRMTGGSDENDLSPTIYPHPKTSAYVMRVRRLRVCAALALGRVFRKAGVAGAATRGDT